MAPNEEPTADVDDLAPSCKFVLRELERDGPLPRQELLSRTRLSPSTIDDALRTLESRQLIIRSRKSDALNQVVAELRGPRDL